MSAPKRIQLSRKKGWRKPEGAIVVSRPSGWGNPFKIGETKWLADEAGNPLICPVPNAETAVAYFRWYLEQSEWRMARARELIGHDLACWCPLDQPCHADVLLDIANRDNT